MRRYSTPQPTASSCGRRIFGGCALRRALHFASIPTEAELGARLDACRATWAREGSASHGASHGASRVRLSLGADGAVRIEHAPHELTGRLDGSHPIVSLDPAVVAEAPIQLVRVDALAVSSADARLRHKCTERSVYDEARARVGAGQCAAARSAGAAALSSAVVFDALLVNEAGEVTECAIANVALQGADGQWCTPPLDCGLLAGTMRAALLEKGAMEERVITLDDVRAAQTAGRPLVGFNALRGVYRLRVEGMPPVGHSIFSKL